MCLAFTCRHPPCLPSSPTQPSPPTHSTTPRLLCFDVYGTLVDWETGIRSAFGPVLSQSPSPDQFTRSHLLSIYHSLEHAQQSQTPASEWPYSDLLATIHPRWVTRLGLPAPSKEESVRFGESVGSWPAFPDTVDALRRLSKYYKLVGLSNVDRESFRKTNEGSLQGFEFDSVTTARDVGSYRPDLRNFEYMLGQVGERFGVERAQVLQTAQSQFHDHFPAKKVGVAVTYTADQFQGIYRGKQYHAPDFGEVIARAHARNCHKMVLTTMTLPGAYQNLEVARQYPDTCTMTLGVHPYHAAEIYAEEGYLSKLREFGLKLRAEEKSPLVAFGEIGLDYVYLERADEETQQRAFREQLDVAVEMQLPLFLHVREACEDFVDIIGPYLARLPRGGLVHSFAGTREEMLRLVGMGFEVSVNGVAFREEEGLRMVRDIPLDRLQLETDAPWCELLVEDRIAPFLQGARDLPPARKHGRFARGQMVKGRNESCTIERVAMAVAGLKGVSLQEVAEAAWGNSVRMFGLEGR
ncbi:hypothetical protein BO71DRAFT_454019 [Aspergillus ellipticus CBS 707.79]|uniref:Uncharacterized protein n=1 Tax=Aspergillus ellipticus CBS 707.79 TaxID=1448320 RepID=A0A319CT61_9EURO|nr:hypothetical protein BO71DRAFT_454019 [Aspergillus ellipticus CBS 707.79]